jgi:hypothetical protein
VAVARGGFAASAENARAHNQGVIDHVRRGTPKRPGVLETYVFAMFNENQEPGEEEIERHFGLYVHPGQVAGLPHYYLP